MRGKSGKSQACLGKPSIVYFNSGATSALIRPFWLYTAILKEFFCFNLCLQCFDAVGWVA